MSREINRYLTEYLKDEFQPFHKIWKEFEDVGTEWESEIQNWGKITNLPVQRKRVSFLLGNDREIGAEVYTPEKRVGINPDQAQELRGYLKDAGIELDLLVMRGAGDRCGYADSDFISRTGAEIVSIPELPFLEEPVDVVHSLKEPSTYEATIRGPVIRIGALHTGTFHQDSGIAKMLQARNFAGIFDGSFIGRGTGVGVVIRSTMSIYAGMDAAVIVLNYFRNQQITPRNIVIIGGGIVGRAAARVIAPELPDSRIILFDIDKNVAEKNFINKPVNIEIRQNAPNNTKTVDETLMELKPDALILGVAVPEGKAPKVVSPTAIKVMARGRKTPVVVDVSIDEGGSVQVEGIPKDASFEEVVSNIRSALGNKAEYIAEQNMPRKYTQAASRDHGRAVLPYLASLLRLCASLGNTVEVINFLRKSMIMPELNGAELKAQIKEVMGYSLTRRILHDLRNGLVFSNLFHMDREVIKDPQLFSSFLRDKNIYS